jgi:hypothetical protein
MHCTAYPLHILDPIIMDRVQLKLSSSTCSTESDDEDSQHEVMQRKLIELASAGNAVWPLPV